jgi:predicted DNA-binding transcriptional regulator AlpA
VTDNAHLIVQAAHEAQATLGRARQALKRLDRSGAIINVNTVAQAASVSRSWIYRHPAVRAEIDNLRTTRPRPGSSPPPSAQRASTESLKRRLESALGDIGRLRTENAALQDQVAKMFGEQRVARRGPRS